jgi:hypothetical protein
LDTPLEYFSNGTLPHNSREVTEDHQPLDTSFSVCNKLFTPPIENKMTIVPSITTSLKSKKVHLLHTKDYAQIVGNILKAFWLATTEKETIEDVLQKNSQKVDDLKK